MSPSEPMMLNEMPSLFGSAPVRIISGALGTAPFVATFVTRRLDSIAAVGATADS